MIDVWKSNNYKILKEKKNNLLKCIYKRGFRVWVWSKLALSFCAFQILFDLYEKSIKISGFEKEREA
jgi:hypothetical protein